MAKMISTVETVLSIPANWKGFPNDRPLVIPMKANQATDVPEFILDFYTKNRPQQFRDSTKPRRIVVSKGPDQSEYAASF